VCSGDELELNCTVAGRVLEWTVSLMPPSEDMTFEYPLTSPDPDPLPPHTIKVNGSISLIFSRITPQNSHPLKSRLLISPATSVINGTVVVCEDGETRTNLSTRVNVVHINSTLTDKAVQGRSIPIIAIFVEIKLAYTSLQSKSYWLIHIKC
jgi:hypothetical protein